MPGCSTARMRSQSHATLCDPTDYSPPGSSAHGIFQARILEWVAIFYSSLSIFTPNGCLGTGLPATDCTSSRDRAFKVSDPGGGGSREAKTPGNVGLHWRRAPAAEKDSQEHAGPGPRPSSLSVAFRNLGRSPLGLIFSPGPAGGRAEEASFACWNLG